GANLRILRIRQRRQRLRIERALVLRQRGAGKGDGRDQQQDQNRAGSHRPTLFARDRYREGGATYPSPLVMRGLPASLKLCRPSEFVARRSLLTAEIRLLTKAVGVAGTRLRGR